MIKYPLLLATLLTVACDSATSTDTGTGDSADTGMDTDTGDSGMDTDSGDTGDTDTATASLYDQLGGAPAVSLVVDTFIAKVAADPKINWFFADTDIPHLKAQLNDQICAATGGPCTYTGADMKTAHAGMAITNDQFDALTGDLLAALDELGIPYALDGSQTIDPLLLALVGMKGDIVTDADGSGVYFNQLGGHAAVEAVIDTFLGHVAADARINSFFASTDLADLRGKLVDQVCQATGGYCTYKGKSMLEAHTGMNITDDDFNALVEDLILAFDDLGVPHSDTLDGSELGDALLVALAGMHDDIVGH